MKIYISGPISGYEDKNRLAFIEAAEAVERIGHNAVTPHDLQIVDPRPDNWTEQMRRDLEYITAFDAIVVIAGWDLSAGAKIECAIAQWMGIPVYKLVDGMLQIVEFKAELFVTII